MVKIVFVSKDASLNEKSVKNLDLKTLHVKCNVKQDSFGKRHTWKVKGAYYSVYAKDTGRHSSENKYDLPPPVDEELYFNTMAILKHSDEKITNENVVDLTKEEWEKTYEHLFGGFENLDDTSGEMSVDEEEENLSESEKTKQGYKKDGFVVDDDDEDDEDYVPEEEDEEDDEDLEETETSENTDDYEESEGEESEGEESEGEESDGEESEDDETDDECYSELSEDSYCSSDEDGAEV
tara:strand:- start:6350 stop:7063 length:714 start_codon:yes stop_codon:yes gene_type:complete